MRVAAGVALLVAAAMLCCAAGAAAAQVFLLQEDPNLAAKYLDPERASVLVVNPAGRAEPETPAGAGDPLDASAPKEE